MKLIDADALIIKVRDLVEEYERPRFRCPKCGIVWVYHEPMCIVCGTLGTALNKRAERILRKTQRSEENETTERR